MTVRREFADSNAFLYILSVVARQKLGYLSKLVWLLWNTVFPIFPNDNSTRPEQTLSKFKTSQWAGAVTLRWHRHQPQYFIGSPNLLPLKVGAAFKTKSWLQNNVFNKFDGCTISLSVHWHSKMVHCLGALLYFNIFYHIAFECSSTKVKQRPDNFELWNKAHLHSSGS